MPDSRRVLVVDDNLVNRRVAAAFLKRLGWEVEEAGDGEEALAVVGRGAFGLVLLDVSMPGMSGLDVCRRIRAGEHGSHLPLVAYTAHALSEEKAAILEAGFDDILIKPINLQDLSAALQRRGFS